MTEPQSPRLGLSMPGRLILGAGLVATAAAALAGCFPNSALVIAERDVVVTVFDPNRNFADYMTYVMPDSVVHVDNSDDPDKSDPDRTYDDLILSNVESNLSALGWIRDTSTGPSGTAPDVAVFVYATSTAWVGWESVPCGTCWGWWPGWGYYPGYPGWGPGWGSYYPPWVTVPYEFNTGTVFVEMGRPQEADTVAMRYPVIWSMALNGIVENSVSSTSQRITGLINQGFTQSPYLGDGK